MSDPKIPACSFCGQSSAGSFLLIASETAFICDRCVLVSLDILREEIQSRSAAVAFPVRGDTSSDEGSA